MAPTLSRSSAVLLLGFAGVTLAAGASARRSGSVAEPRWLAAASQESVEAGAPELEPGREFYFTRGVYTTGFRRGRWERYFESWSVDYPKADRQFLIGLRRLTNIDAYEMENPVRLDDPNLRSFPFLYMLEVGYMSMTDEEARGLRDYLLAGGFLMIDDFWGTLEWRNFEEEMQRVLPEYTIVDIPLDHPLLSSFYDIDGLLQVPNVGQGRSGGPTWERDGFTPALRGIFDDRGRLMVAINWNTDLGDAWEWAEDPFYPLKFSNFAYQMGVNTIIYAMSH